MSPTIFAERCIIWGNEEEYKRLRQGKHRHEVGICDQGCLSIEGEAALWQCMVEDHGWIHIPRRAQPAASRTTGTESKLHIAAPVPELRVSLAPEVERRRLAS